MANKKLTQLPELQSADVDGADIIPVVDDIGGTPITKKVTITNLMGQAPVQPADIADFATQVSLGNVQVSLGNLQASLGTAATTDASAYATSAQGAKADTAQQPPSEGAFANGDKTKLDGIEASADVTDTANVTSAGALMDSEVTNLADVKAFNPSDYATSAQGALAGTAIQNAGVDLSVSGNILKLIDPNGTQIGSNIDLSLYLDDTNLARITSGTLASSGIATFTRDDSTTFTIDLSNLTPSDAEIKTGYENNSDTNAFTDAEKTKLSNAIVSGSVNPVYFANQAAFPSASTNHGAVAHSHADGAMYYAHGGSWVKLANDSDIALASLSDLTLTAPSSEDVVKYNGSAWVNGQVSVDVATPLSTALRGTDDVHIGAHPEQSTKVMDSVPEGNAFMVADASGLKFLVKEASASVFVVKGPNASPVRLAEASELPSFSLTKDSGEPDIEVTDSDGEVYSVISGDSDSLGSNGLPIRQGYQLPSIGSNPSPLLISGGTIS